MVSFLFASSFIHMTIIIILLLLFFLLPVLKTHKKAIFGVSLDNILSEHYFYDPFVDDNNTRVLFEKVLSSMPNEKARFACQQIY